MAEFRHICHCMGIQDLPEEILERIMSYLSPYTDCMNAALVCRNWHCMMKGVIKQRERAFCLAARAGSLRWSPRERSGNCARARCMHSVCYVDGVMYMFGGTLPSSPVNLSGTCYCDLQEFDMGKRLWSRLIAAGEYPSPKAAASMVHHDGSLILFGGWAPPAPNPPHQPPHISDDLHIYNIADNRWRRVVTNAPPPPMSSHKASMVGDLMVVFGGSVGNRRKSNDVWVLSLQSMAWSRMEMNGRAPPARDKHAQVLLDDGHILVVGGQGNYGRELTDVWLLDMSEVPWCWKEIEILNQEQAAPKIFSHAFCKIGDCIVFFSHLKTKRKSANNWQLPTNLVGPPTRTWPSNLQLFPSNAVSSRTRGVERGCLGDLPRGAKRPCYKPEDSSRDQGRDTGRMDVDQPTTSSAAAEDTGSGHLPTIGCPCSPTCTCRTPVVSVIKSFSDGFLDVCQDSSVANSKIPYGEHQYVLDISSAISGTLVEWLEIPDPNAKRTPINPNHPTDDKLRYGFAPEALFPSICVGRAEIIRFGGFLECHSLPRTLNDQYFAY